MLNPLLGIDLGTTNLLVYIKGKGIVFDEPSVVAKNNKKNKVIALGNEAVAMEGRTPINISTSRPLRDGVISEYKTTRQMLAYLINKFCGKSFFRPTLIIAVPSKITQVERRAVRNCALECGVKEVYIVEEPWAAAIGSGMSISEAGGNMVVDIGGGTADIAVLSLNGIVISDSIRIGGNTFDELIKNYAKKTYSLLIGDSEAERIKKEIGSAYISDKDPETEIKGRDLIEGSPHTIKMKSSETVGIFDDTLKKICLKIKETLENTPPDLCGDIIDRGILLTGGSSQLKGLDRLIQETTKVPVHRAEDPLKCVVKGCGKALDMLDKIKGEYIQVIN